MQCCRWMKVCGSGFEDPASGREVLLPVGLLAHSALARNTSALAWEGFRSMQYVLARLSKTTLHRILQEWEPLEFEADTEAESEAESEGDADI